MKLRALLVCLALAACRHPPSESMTTTTAAKLEPSPRRPGSCDTLIGVEAPDTLRVEQGLALYANEDVGLAVVDVIDPDHPKLRGTIAAVGKPTGVFVVRGIAVYVYSPSTDRVAVRAIALDPVRSLGEIALAGVVRDARRVGDYVVVTREIDGGATVVTSFGVHESGPGIEGEVTLNGTGAEAGAAPRGLAVAYGSGRTWITWVTVDPDNGTLAKTGTTDVRGTIPHWRTAHQVVDVTEDQRVRLVLCATIACAPAGAAAYAAIDFSTPSAPRVVSTKQIAGAGDGVVGFQGTRLAVARPATDRSDASDLVFYDTEGDLAAAGKVRIRGTVGSIVVRDSGDVMTVGWTGSSSAGKRAIIHHVDARGAPRLVGAVSFGGDWTWTRAYDDDRILGFDSSSTLAALPITTLRRDLTQAAQILAFDPTGPRAVGEEPLTLTDRVLFVDSRLLAFSADGVVVVRHEGE